MNAIEIAYARYCKERFPLAAESQLRALEIRLGIDFPSDYREFVLRFNGGIFIEPQITPVGPACPQDALNTMNGIKASYRMAELEDTWTVDLFDDNNPPKILPIGSTAMGGLIILDTAPGQGRGDIYLKEAFGDFYHLASGIEEFFSLLRDPPVI